MKAVLDVIFYRTREGSFEFRVILDGKHYETIVGMQIAKTIEMTSEQFGGFHYNDDRKAFETMSATTGAEPLQLIEEFERQGFVVVMYGSLEHIDNIQSAA
jgi:hypothetical protein